MYVLDNPASFIQVSFDKSSLIKRIDCWGAGKSDIAASRDESSTVNNNRSSTSYAHLLSISAKLNPSARLILPLSSKPVTLAWKDTAHLSCTELIYDTLHTDVCSQREVKSTSQHDYNVKCYWKNIQNGISLSSDLTICIAHAEVGQRPKDEAEPAIKQRRHDW